MTKEIKNKALKKFLIICKSYLLSIFTGLFLAFMILLIVISCQTNGRVYVFETNILTENFKIEMELRKENNALILCGYLNGELSMYESGSYKITDGELYSIIATNGGNVIDKQGKINAYEIAPTDSMFEGSGLPEDQIEKLKTLKFVCKTNVTLRTISIVFMSIYGAGAIAGLIILILDKCNVINLKNDTKKDSTSKVAA